MYNGRLRRARGFRGRKITAGNFISHYNGLAECRLEPFGQEPRRKVGAATWRKWNNDDDGLAGPILRRRWRLSPGLQGRKRIGPDSGDRSAFAISYSLPSRTHVAAR